MEKPRSTLGLRHVALWVQDFAACEYFYTVLLGMNVEWRPDPDNLYLCSGQDNLALHRAPPEFNPAQHQRLDHIGFMLRELIDVQDWYDYLCRQQVKVKTAPRLHRDGTSSFYCLDPDGNRVQMIYHPKLVNNQ